MGREAYDKALGWSQSEVKAYLTCPEFHRRRYIDKSLDDSDTKSLEFGRGVDEYVANKGDFLSKWKRVARRSGADNELTASVWDEVVDTGDFVLSQPIFKRMTSGSASQVPLYAKWGKHKVKGLLDFLKYEGDEAVIVDLKTTKDADWRKFKRSVIEYGYIFQLAWYAKLVMSQKKKVKKVSCHIAAVDSRRFEFYSFDPALISKEMEDYETMLDAITDQNNPLHILSPHTCPLGHSCKYALVSSPTFIRSDDLSY